MKKRGIVVIAIVVCALAAVAALFGYRMVQQKQQVRDLLELGNQYLEEEQYEEAIVAYKQLLAIEPKEEIARENIVVAAVEWSDDLIEVHEYDKAEEVVADVYSIVPDERLEIKRQEIMDKRNAYEKELLEIKQKEEERKQALEQIAVDLSELAQICASGDVAAVYSYLGSAEYQALTDSEYVEFDKKYETEYGTLGLYKEGKFVYFGDYEGEARSGKGTWYIPDTAGTSQYVARGDWSNDKPNGEQVEKQLPDYVMHGTVINGLWDGEVSLQFTGENGELLDWPITFHHGSVEIVDTNDHGSVISKIYGSNGFPEAELMYDESYESKGISGFVR